MWDPVAMISSCFAYSSRRWELATRAAANATSLDALPRMKRECAWPRLIGPFPYVKGHFLGYVCPAPPSLAPAPAFPGGRPSGTPLAACACRQVLSLDGAHARPPFRLLRRRGLRARPARLVADCAPVLRKGPAAKPPEPPGEQGAPLPSSPLPNPALPFPTLPLPLPFSPLPHLPSPRLASPRLPRCSPRTCTTCTCCTRRCGTARSPLSTSRSPSTSSSDETAPSPAPTCTISSRRRTASTLCAPSPLALTKPDVYHQLSGARSCHRCGGGANSFSVRAAPFSRRRGGRGARR